MRRRVLRIGLVVLALLMVVAGVGSLRQRLSGGDNDVATITSGGGAEVADGGVAPDSFGGGYDVGAPVPMGDEAKRQGGAFSSSGSTIVGGSGGSGTSGSADSSAGEAFGGSRDSQGGVTDFGGDVPMGAPAPLSYSQRIIKDGRVEIEVPRGGFDRGYNQVLALAAKAGGTVVQSQTFSQEDQASGELTIRVPAERFEALLTSTGGIGKVLHRSVESADVSGEFVDLESRLRHLQAQERFYLDLMSKARTVGDAVAINQNLSTVQAEMEQVQGRMRLLDEKTTFSRLTVALHEPGANPLISQVPPVPRGVLAQAWADSVEALQQTLGALLIGAFTLAPLALLALVAWALWRRLRPRPAQDPRPAAAPSEGPLSVG